MRKVPLAVGDAAPAAAWALVAHMAGAGNKVAGFACALVAKSEKAVEPARSKKTNAVIAGDLVQPSYMNHLNHLHCVNTKW